MTVAVLIPYRDSDPIRRRNYNWCEARWRAILPGAQVIQGTSPTGPFNRSAAINSARKAITTETDVLVVADADTHGDPAAIKYCIGQCSVNDVAPWYLPYDRYYNLTDTCSQNIVAQRNNSDILESMFEWEHRITSPPVSPYGDPISGILIMRREAFDLVGGFDEMYKGWGYEDRDMADRLDELWGPHHRVKSFVFHLWHPVAGDPFNSQECKDNAERYQRAYRHP